MRNHEVENGDVVVKRGYEIDLRVLASDRDEGGDG